MRAAVLLTAVLSGCQAFPGAESAGRRAGADAFVVFTCPVQIPWMSGRDAWHMVDDPALSAVALPLTFTGQFLWHTGLTALHLLDLTATPLHLFNDLEEPRIYTRYEWPMEYDPEGDLGAEAGEMALWGIGWWGGAVGSYYFATEYVPRALGL